MGEAKIECLRFWERLCAGSVDPPHIRVVLPVIAALPLLLTACPNDDIANSMGGTGGSDTGGSDTGGDGDGDTGEVGGTVPLDTIPPVPQSIGNGLVY
jgi:hypothetical protein